MNVNEGMIVAAGRTFGIRGRIVVVIVAVVVVAVVVVVVVSPTRPSFLFLESPLHPITPPNTSTIVIHFW